MTRVFNRQALEPLTTFWRVYRRDGITLGLCGHDRDLYFEGIVHRASPGMVPSAVRRSGDLAPDSAEVKGALTHDAIAAADVAAGRFDGAQVEIGVVDWETHEHAVLYRGEIGDVSREAGEFAADLRSAKTLLEQDVVPRTSPSCRAQFCGPGCGLSAARFTHDAVLTAVGADSGGLAFAVDRPESAFAGGSLRWVDGPHTGRTMTVASADDPWIVVADELAPDLAPGMTAELREGCDHTFATCAGRFENAINFRGEPFIPGNDFMARYPSPSAP